jgi:hypothetical protein
LCNPRRDCPGRNGRRVAVAGNGEDRMPEIELTQEEQKAIAALQKVAKNWPKSLWLYSASGALVVMKKDANGNRVHLPGGASGYDPNREVADIAIENDGGDY